MKITFVMVAAVVAATWCGSAWASAPSSATSATSATSPGGAASEAESLNHKKYAKYLADIPKMLDQVQALEDKLPDQETQINEQIRNLKEMGKNGKEAPVKEEALKRELALGTPSAAAKQYRALKMQIIAGRMDIAKKLGPGLGVYGKCQDMGKIDPKDDALKTQGDALAQKVKGHYEGVLLKIATLFEAISETKNQDGVYRMIQAVDPDNPGAAAYFKKK